MGRRGVPQKTGALPILEFLLLIGCFVLPMYLWTGQDATIYLFYESGLNASVFTAGLLIVLMYFQGLYGPERTLGANLVLRLVTAIGAGFLLEATVFYVQKNLFLPLRVMVTGTGLGFAALLVSRLISDGLLGRAFLPEKVLLAGATPVTRKIARHVEAHRSCGIAIVGFLDDALEPGTALEGGKVLGPLAAVQKIRHEVRFTRLVADLPGERVALLEEGTPGLRVERAEFVYESLFSQVCSLRPADLLLDGALSPPRWRLVLQSVYTNLLGLAGVIVALPVMIFFAAVIRLSGSGPVFELQKVMGWNLMPFHRIRFCCHRTVKTEAGERRELTAIGRLLQRPWLRELPQLINIMRGEMALVGPPPTRVEFSAAIMEVLPSYRLRYLVRPGLVSWSGINVAGDHPLVALEYDLHYMKSLSLFRDLSILQQALTARRAAGGQDAPGDSG